MKRIILFTCLMLLLFSLFVVAFALNEPIAIIGEYGINLRYNDSLNPADDESVIPKSDLYVGPDRFFRYYTFWRATCQHVAHDEWHLYIITDDHPEGVKQNTTYSWYAQRSYNWDPEKYHSWRDNPNLKSKEEIEALGEGEYIYPNKKDPTPTEDGFYWRVKETCIWQKGWWSGTGIVCGKEGYEKVILKYEGGEVPPEDPTPSNKPPIADLRIPIRVTQGNNVSIDASGSYDPDGYIVSYTYSLPSYEGSIYGSSGTVWFKVSGTYNASVTVTDNDGLQDTDTRQIIIDPPNPWAIISYTGLRIENHKIRFSCENSITPTHYPLDESKTKWEVFPVSEGLSFDDIKYRDTLIGTNVKEIMFKKAGKYKVKVTITNTAGYSSTAEVEIEISPNLPPIAKLSVPSTAIRDQVDAYGNHYGIIPIYNTSISPDNDVINKFIFYITFDSNNDGNHLNETTMVLFNSDSYPKNENIYYNDRPDLLLYDYQEKCLYLAYPSELAEGLVVGNIRFDIEVWEMLDESNSFPEFLSPDDIKSDSTLTWR